MSQIHFDLHFKCKDLEARNAELEDENAALKDKVSDLGFEIALLKDVCDYDQEEQKDTLIENLREQIREKNHQECVLEMKIHDQETEIAALQTTIAEKDADILSLKATLYEKDAELSRLLIQNAEPIDINLGDVFNEENELLFENQKMGEDVGDEPIAKRTKRKKQCDAEMNLFVNDDTDGCGSVASNEESADHFVDKPFATKKKQPKSSYKKKKKYILGPRVVLPDGRITRRNPNSRPYKSRIERVYSRSVIYDLNDIFTKKSNFQRVMGKGHDYVNVRYAQFYGNLTRGGDPVRLETIVLSSEKKVYQLIDYGEHYEIRWQNDKAVMKPSYGTIKLPGEGGGAQISLKNPFAKELGIEL